MLVVKQMNGFSYRVLAFHLADSRSYRTFCRLGILDEMPSKSALNANFKSLQPATLEAIHRAILGSLGKSEGRDGSKSPRRLHRDQIQHPRSYRSELLWDCVRSSCE